jgi:UDP-glucose 4-epimerase
MRSYVRPRPDLEHSDLVLNVASGRQTTMRSLVATAREVFDLRGEPEWGAMQRRAWDTPVWAGDPSTAVDAIAWTAATPLE